MESGLLRGERKLVKWEKYSKGRGIRMETIGETHIDRGGVGVEG